MNTLDMRIAAHDLAVGKRWRELREYAASTLGGLWQPEDDMTVQLTTRLIKQDEQIREMAEPVVAARCDHGEDKQAEYLRAFRNSEIYRCECGALLSINDPMRAMTSAEIYAAVHGEVHGDDCRVGV